MKVGLARIGVLVVAATGLMATMIPSASATTVKIVTFAGQASLGCGLGYPPVDPAPQLPTVNTDPDKNEQLVTIPAQGAHCNFTISANCVKTSVGIKGKTGGPELCAITAAGTVWGYCGYSTGMGVANVDNLGPLTTKNQVTTTFEFVGIGGLLTITGGSLETNIAGEAVAAPTTGACATNTATGFTVAGEVVYKDCTGQTVEGVCTQP